MGMKDHNGVITNKVKLDILTKQFEQFDVDNHNDHQRLFEALDKINQRLTKIETKLTIEKEQENKEITHNMWQISLIVSTIVGGLSMIVSIFLHR